MTTRIIIVNEGPDHVEVQAGTDPVYVIAPGTFQGQYIYKEKEVHITEVVKDGV